MSLLLTVLITGVIFVNGFTDAPGAITGIVVTRTLSYRAAVALAAVCNLLGIVAIATVNASVANTVIQIAGGAQFSGIPPEHAGAALGAAMLSIIIFAVCNWYFGIPTSESHALVAALAASSLALSGKTDISGWDKVFLGLMLSLVLGLMLGLVFHRALTGMLSRFSSRMLGGAQILGAASSAFMHGAQDGQKFIAVLILAELTSSGEEAKSIITLSGHIPAVFLCALAMSLGTAMGGRRIIYNVGAKMVAMDKIQTVCSDIGSSLCLLLASFAGIPMSTTHAKTSAIMGAGLGSGTKLNLRVISGMLTAWAVTFPVCGALGYVLTKLFVFLLAL